MTYIVDAVVVVSLLMVFRVAVEVIAVRFVGLRLTDWLGYVFCGAAVVAMPLRLWDTSPLLGWAVFLAVVVAVVGARRTVAVWRRGDTVYGIFTFGREPDGVVDRIRLWSLRHNV